MGTIPPRQGRRSTYDLRAGVQFHRMVLFLLATSGRSDHPNIQLVMCCLLWNHVLGYGLVGGLGEDDVQGDKDGTLEW